LAGAADGLALAKVLETGKVLEDGADVAADVEGATILAVLEEGPELLDTIELAEAIVLHHLLLKVVEQITADAAFEGEAVEAEETLETVAQIAAGVLEGQDAELVVHALVKVISQKVRPEAEELVGKLRLTRRRSLAFLHRT